MDANRVIRVKVALVGDAQVGKTSLVRVYNNRSAFSKEYKQTVGVDLLVCTVALPELKTTVELYIHDVGGLDVFKDAAPKYVRRLLVEADALADSLSPQLDGVEAVIVVYDVMSTPSFDACGKWLELVRAPPPQGAGAGGAGSLPGVLVATKSDLNRSEVDSVSAARWAEKHGLMFFETSSKPPSFNIDVPFMELARAITASYNK